MHGFALQAGSRLELWLGGLGIPFERFNSTDSILEQLGVLAFLTFVLMRIKNPLEYMKDFKPKKIYLYIILALFLISLYQMNAHSEFLYFQF